MKDQDEKIKNKNQSLNSERDGSTQVRSIWSEKIVSVLKPCGTEKPGLWFTHARIKRRVMDHYGALPDNIAQILYGLVKDGYLERASKPDNIVDQFAIRKGYIYRLTSKPFTVKRPHGMNAPLQDIEKGFQVWLDNPKMPKWFRDMMK